jgi:hypothetical protein
MSEAVELAIAAIATVVSGVSGIRQAPTYPNETQNVDPFAVTYFVDGRLECGAVGTKRDLININVDLLIPKNDLARDLAILTPFIDTISAALVGQVSGTGARFNNTISTFDTLRIKYMGDVDYAGVPMRGYSFTMENVKILVSL